MTNEPTLPPDLTSVSDRHRKQTDTQSIPSASSVVRRNECKIIVNENNAVQFCGSDARSLAVGNYSCCTEHTLHRDRSCAHSRILLQLHWVLGTKTDAFPESQWEREVYLPFLSALSVTMSEHNKYIYKLDSGRLPERNNHHSWPPIIKEKNNHRH